MHLIYFLICVHQLSQLFKCDVNNSFVFSLSLHILPFRSDQIVYPFTMVPIYIVRCLKWEKLTYFSYTFLIYKGMHCAHQCCHDYFKIKFSKYHPAHFNFGFFFQSSICLHILSLLTSVLIAISMM